MLIQAFLRGFIVIGRNQQGAVGADALGVPGKGNRLVRGVGSGAGNHGDPLIDDLHGQRHDAFVFRVREGGGFAGGSARDDPMRAVGDVKFDQLAVRLFVEGALPKRRDDRNEGS